MPPKEYFQCPYCPRFIGGHGVPVPKKVGRYKIWLVGDIILIFRCERCAKKFRVRMAGSVLTEADMDAYELQNEEGENDG